LRGGYAVFSVVAGFQPACFAGWKPATTVHFFHLSRPIGYTKERGTMIRILLGECKQEVSSFNPALSHYDDFTFSHGDELIDAHAGAQSEMSGALGVFMARDDIDLVPAYGARAISSGGTLAAADWQRIAGEFLDAVRDAPLVDAVYFSLHG